MNIDNQMHINRRGSIWQIWDLHIHTPFSHLNNGFGNDWDNYVKELFKKAITNNVTAIGITDYFTIDGYKKIKTEYLEKGNKLSELFTADEIKKIKSILILPNIEFRLNKFVGSNRINFHVLLSNEIPIKDIEENFLHEIDFTYEAVPQSEDEKRKLKNTNLETLGARLKKEHQKFQDRTDLYIGMMNAVVDDEQIGKLLANKKNIFEGKYLIALPSDEDLSNVSWNGQDHQARKLLIQKSDILIATNPKTIQWALGKKHPTINEFIQEFKSIKPCIGGSDAHTFDELFTKNAERKVWINSDITFKGLKQILIEPDRVFIGDEPDLLKRVRTNQTKFIKSLSVKKIAGVTIDDLWFDNFHIDLNSGLVAIIGNKGNGKSAITDIISLCANTHQEPSNFSFLTNNKFRKIKPYNLSEKFEATLTWEDGSSVTKRLNENPDKNLPERVKYIPQNFLERLCTNIESDDFEKELKHIIFSHTPNEERLRKSSLDELINYKSSLVNDEIGQIQTRISNLNREIKILEEKATPGFKKSIENQLELKKGELTTHRTIEPQKPQVGEESEVSKKLVENLTQLREQIKNIEEEIEQQKEKKANLSIKKEELNRTTQYYKNIDEQLKKIQDDSNEFVQVLLKHNITKTDIFSYQINTTKLSDLVTTTNQELATIEDLLDIDKKNSKTKQLQNLNTQLQQGQEILDKPAKEQQKYLDDLKAWEVKKKEIEGNNETEGSLKFYEAQLIYLNEKLIPEINQKYEARKKLSEELYDKKLSLIEIRKKLFQPVTQFISEFKELKERYDVKIDVALELRSFSENFFNHINQGRIGTFNGREEGYKKLLEIVEKTQFTTSEGFLQFAEELIDNLRYDKRVTNTSAIDIPSQLKKGVEVNELYDFIYNADYLQPVYNLKLGNKTLQELSPGERGALLLIFYLILDNDDIPLIIDQPEENLDNESVYHILVHFIKKVKEKRQIIIVTHNPNLAIVCDADQIINMQIEKENKNTVKFNSGAIENTMMNKAIVNILEGTLPAFNNRDAKYIR